MSKKLLVEQDCIIERFKIVEDKSPLPILDVQFDGKSISIADLVSIANQLTNALLSKGCSFKPMTKH